jgi:alpha-galactosidase
MKQSQKLAFFGLILLISSTSAILVAQTPPMGWNTWNHFHCGLNETVIMGVADAIAASGLRDAGYTFVNMDDCWQINRTENGVIIPDPEKFPSGLTNLISYVHSKGLKFGLYTDRGLKTCAGRPGSYGYEKIDATTYGKSTLQLIDGCYYYHLQHHGELNM